MTFNKRKGSSGTGEGTKTYKLPQNSKPLTAADTNSTYASQRNSYGVGAHQNPMAALT